MREQSNTGEDSESFYLQMGNSDGTGDIFVYDCGFGYLYDSRGEKTFETSGLPNVTNVRLASLNMKQRFLYHFVQKAKNNEIITVNSPNHYASILDAEDAAEALARLALISSNNRKPIYNLGTGNQTSLMGLAELVNVVGERYNAKAQIVLQDNGTTNTAGEDISLISNDCNRTPIITNEQMIENFFLFD